MAKILFLIRNVGAPHASTSCASGRARQILRTRANGLVGILNETPVGRTGGSTRVRTAGGNEANPKRRTLQASERAERARRPRACRGRVRAAHWRTPFRPATHAELHPFRFPCSPGDGDAGFPAAGSGGGPVVVMQDRQPLHLQLRPVLHRHRHPDLGAQGPQCSSISSDRGGGGRRPGDLYRQGNGGRRLRRPGHAGRGMLAVEHENTANAGGYSISVWCPESAGERPRRGDAPRISITKQRATDYAILEGKDSYDHPDTDAANGISGKESVTWTLRRP